MTSATRCTWCEIVPCLCVHAGGVGRLALTGGTGALVTITSTRPAEDDAAFLRQRIAAEVFRRGGPGAGASAVRYR